MDAVDGNKSLSCALSRALDGGWLSCISGIRIVHGARRRGAGHRHRAWPAGGCSQAASPCASPCWWQLPPGAEHVNPPGHQHHHDDEVCRDGLRQAYLGVLHGRQGLRVRRYCGLDRSAENHVAGLAVAHSHGQGTFALMDSEPAAASGDLGTRLERRPTLRQPAVRPIAHRRQWDVADFGCPGLPLRCDIR